MIHKIQWKIVLIAPAGVFPFLRITDDKCTDIVIAAAATIDAAAAPSVDPSASPTRVIHFLWLMSEAI